MNTRKDRYAVRISESSYIEMQEQALRDGAKQGIAVAQGTPGACVQRCGRSAASAADTWTRRDRR